MHLFECPKYFRKWAEVAKTGLPAKRNISLSPNTDLNEAVLRLEMTGADAGFVEGIGRPHGVMEMDAANRVLSGSS